jgi:hypothetical protein
MKRTLIAAAGLALVAASGLASAASWSVIVQPGVYGRVAIGGYAEAPQVYSQQPVVAVDDGYGGVTEEYVDPAYQTTQEPVYLWVPEYQRLHWAQYCNQYGAYGVPVYFVDDGWYRDNVMRRNWSVEQRSWNQQQWLDQDRIARDRFERHRFEQQRQEQQARDPQRWNNEQSWRQPQRQIDDQRAQPSRWEQERRDHDRADRDQQYRMRWGSAHGYLPQPVQAQQPAQTPRPQPGNGWQQPGNQGNRGNNAGHQAGNPPQQPQQPAGAGQPPRGSDRGAPVQPVQNVSDRHDESRGQDRGQARGQGDGRAQYEHGRDQNRDR